jgi:hypothetical protein
MSFDFPPVDQGSIHHGDMAIVKYLYDPLEIITSNYQKIMTEGEFQKFMETYKPQSKDWKAIECI